ncbi:hypothetical protein CLF_105658 [Clonorchis sinensis]|uniref:Uncharacterized protein n=1 Tax=Clonorchis sinensis TaxID=79923 RepID=G7YDX4_CLOSI|nr:hypothetical protein CLF_105658 [Clonorchis sinensis]
MPNVGDGGKCRPIPFGLNGYGNNFRFYNYDSSGCKIFEIFKLVTLYCFVAEIHVDDIGVWHHSRGPALRTDDYVRLASALRAASARHMVPTSSGISKSLFKPRHSVYLAAFNMRTLKQVGQQAALALTLYGSEASVFNTDVMLSMILMIDDTAVLTVGSAVCQADCGQPVSRKSSFEHLFEVNAFTVTPHKVKSGLKLIKVYTVPYEVMQYNWLGHAIDQSDFWEETYGSRKMFYRMRVQHAEGVHKARASNAQLPISPPQIIGGRNCGSHNHCTTSTRFLTTDDEVDFWVDMNVHRV